MRIEIRLLPQGLLVRSIRVALEESDRDDQRQESVVVLADAIKQAASSYQPSGMSSEL